jgi:hypothetical protein
MKKKKDMEIKEIKQVTHKRLYHDRERRGKTWRRRNKYNSARRGIF